MLSCPLCRQKIKPIRTHGRPTYCCPQHGAFESLKNTSALFGPQVSRWLMESKDLMANPSTKSCPSCKKLMEEIKLDLPNKLLLDRCRQCRFFWFDKNEWEMTKDNFKNIMNFFNSVKEKGKKSETSIFKVQAEALSYDEFQRRLFLPNIKISMDTGKASTQLGNATFIIIVLLILFGTMSFAPNSGRSFVESLGFKPADSMRMFGLTYFSYFFVHAHLAHLVGNLIFFFVFAPAAEEDLGTANFLIMLALGTAFGAVFYSLMGHHAQYLIGASGGISTVFIYHVIKFPHHKINYFTTFFKFNFSVTWYGAFWFLMEVFSMLTQAGGMVAVGCHIGGAIIGIIFALII